MKRIGSCPSIVESASYFQSFSPLDQVSEHLPEVFSDIASLPALDMQTVPENGADDLSDEDDDDLDDRPQKPAAKGSKGRPGKHVGLTAKERKERRLVSNRLAARRAYYRRLEKLTGLQRENSDLQRTVEQKDFQIESLKALVRKCGYDPDAFLQEGIDASPAKKPARGRKPTLTDYMGGLKMEGGGGKAAVGPPSSVAASAVHGVPLDSAMADSLPRATFSGDFFDENAASEMGGGAFDLGGAQDFLSDPMLGAGPMSPHADLPSPGPERGAAAVKFESGYGLGATSSDPMGGY